LDYNLEGARLAVVDRGGAAAAPVNGAGYGLTGMRERAELLGGELSAAPTSDGFKVELWIPA
jgi:signal transduction histidine kinase